MTSSHYLLLAWFATGLLTCWVTIKLVLRFCSGLAHKKDRSKEFHHANETYVPRLGGVGLTIAFLVISTSIYFSGICTHANEKNLLIVVVSSCAMFLLGLCDDVRAVSAKWKLIAQIVIATAVCFSGIRIELVRNPITEMDFALGLSGYFATILWLVTLTNLINLIDGIDGLAGGICLMLMALLAIAGGNPMSLETLIAVGVAGSLLSFLKFNYPPAKIYMGDGGAYFLGFLIGLLSILSSNKSTVLAALIAPAFALALPVADTFLAVCRRGMRGLPLFRADQRHIHHRLLSLGFSKERAVLVLYAVSLCCLALSFCVFYFQGRFLPLFTGLLFLIMLVFAHFSGFTKGWFSISEHVGKSLAVRRQTRYALSLTNWLKLEVERRNSVDEIWEDYIFVLKKLGFSKVKLILQDGTDSWEIEGLKAELADSQYFFQRAIPGGTIELYASKAAMSDTVFYLLSDLASETWYKAAARWQQLHPTTLPATAPQAVLTREVAAKASSKPPEPGGTAADGDKENILTFPEGVRLATPRIRSLA